MENRNNTTNDFHIGHERMHGEMLLIILFITLAVQLILIYWQRKDSKSYRNCTTTIMWLIPAIFWTMNHFHQLLLTWTLYTISTIYISFLATRNPLDSNIPRRVYFYYLFIYKLCCAGGVLSYLVVVFNLFGVFSAFPLSILLLITKWSFSLLFLSLYYGCLTRDFAEISAEKMSSTIGFYSESGIPSKLLSNESKDCCVCGQLLETKYFDKTIMLNCNHQAHEYCVRGWCIVGKKSTCPYCKEKVDLDLLSRTPWTQHDIQFALLFDWIRFFIAWQPIIIIISQLAIKAFGLY